MEKIIRATEANVEAITAAIAEAEGKAYTRTISAGAIIATAAEITEYLNIPKPALEGTRAQVDLHAENTDLFCRPRSTQFTLLYKRGEWRVEKICRDYVQRESHRYQITLTEKGKQAVLDRVSNMR